LPRIAEPFTFVVTDPRTYDGDPYEVAERATRQAEAVATILAKCVADATVMARNAQMERELSATGECDAAGFEESPQGGRYVKVLESATYCKDQLKILTKAAGFNPKKRVSA
jgi:hypothetical protein